METRGEFIVSAINPLVPTIRGNKTLIVDIVKSTSCVRMETENIQTGEAKMAFPAKESTLDGLTTVPTSVTLSSEQFERLYLTPMTVRQSSLAKKVGNPTPL